MILYLMAAWITYKTCIGWACLRLVSSADFQLASIRGLGVIGEVTWTRPE
jgi:hypothetical protein